MARAKAKAKSRTRDERRLTDADREALALAIDTACKHSPADCRQLDDKLASGEPWFDIAVFAAEECQEWSLRLKPWQAWPPCAVEPDDVDAPGLEHRGIGSSAALLRRMLAAGVSRFHPDPVGAIEAVKVERVS